LLKESGDEATEQRQRCHAAGPTLSPFARFTIYPRSSPDGGDFFAQPQAESA